MNGFLPLLDDPVDCRSELVLNKLAVDFLLRDLNEACLLTLDNALVRSDGRLEPVSYIHARYK